MLKNRPDGLGMEPGLLNALLSDISKFNIKQKGIYPSPAALPVGLLGLDRWQLDLRCSPHGEHMD